MDSKILIEKWNTSHRGMPKDKSASNYALEKEALFPRNRIVVDLGGGSGTDALFFLEKEHSVILIDISDEALNIARSNSPRKRIRLRNSPSRIRFYTHSFTGKQY